MPCHATRDEAFFSFTIEMNFGLRQRVKNLEEFKTSSINLSSDLFLPQDKLLPIPKFSVFFSSSSWVYWIFPSNLNNCLTRVFCFFLAAVGAKTIIFLFIAIIICAVVALAVFARAKGLWCFAGELNFLKLRTILTFFCSSSPTQFVSWTLFYLIVFWIILKSRWNVLTFILSPVVSFSNDDWNYQLNMLHLTVFQLRVFENSLNLLS